MAFRPEKLNSLLKEEISLIFLHKLQDPSFGLVTVTSVKVSPDIKSAKVYLSVYEKEKREMILEKLTEVKGFIKSQLAGRLSIRRVPELEFYIDDTLDYVEKMENLFKKIHDNDNQADNKPE